MPVPITPWPEPTTSRCDAALPWKCALLVGWLDSSCLVPAPEARRLLLDRRLDDEEEAAAEEEAEAAAVEEEAA